MTYAVPGPIRTNIVSSTSVGGIDSPFTRTRAVLDMMKGWEIMKAVSEGTEYLRENSEALLAKGEEPLEPYVFDYLLLCNKICGASHYNMQMKIIVETPQEFEKWMTDQQTFAEFIQ